MFSRGTRSQCNKKEKKTGKQSTKWLFRLPTDHAEDYPPSQRWLIHKSARWLLLKRDDPTLSTPPLPLTAKKDSLPSSNLHEKGIAKPRRGSPHNGTLSRQELPFLPPQAVVALRTTVMRSLSRTRAPVSQSLRAPARVGGWNDSSL